MTMLTKEEFEAEKLISQNFYLENRFYDEASAPIVEHSTYESYVKAWKAFDKFNLKPETYLKKRSMMVSGNPKGSGSWADLVFKGEKDGW